MKMKITLVLFATFFLCSCSRSFLISNGAADNRPLLFENEYNLSELKEVEVKGHAFFGVPSFAKNNKNNHTSGMLFYFNGIQLGKTPRILPLVSLISMSLASGALLNAAFSGNNEYNERNYRYNPRTGEYKYRSGIGVIPAAIISLPLTGMINNLAWSNSAYSGASRTLKYNLIKENPDIDLFFYPKYDIQRKHVYSGSDITGGKPKFELKYLWIQDATIKGRCKGAKLKL
jgi:hypothetical protein